VRPGYLYPFSTMHCLPDGRQFPWVLEMSYRLGYRTMNELIDERVAEVLDCLRLLWRKPELAEEAANLMGSNAFDAVVWLSSMSSSAQISTHALSTSPVARSGALCHGRSSLNKTGSHSPVLATVRRVRCRRPQQGSRVLDASDGSARDEGAKTAGRPLCARAGCCRADGAPP
jgi:hypothetical protein